MKKYVSNMNLLLKLQHPDMECSCFNEFEMDEEFLCELCLSRLRNQRSKVKRRLRRKAKETNEFFE